MSSAFKGKVLVMDDQVHMRELFQDILDQLGYECHITAEGAEAVDRYREALQSERPFDAVILDLTVAKGLDGRETLKQLIQIHPEVNAIATSGVALSMSDEDMQGFCALLPKPYQIMELHRILEEIIGRKTP